MSSMFSSPGTGAYQQCRRCGKPLGPDEIRCGNCGFVNAPQQVPADMPPFSPGPQWGQKPDQAPPGTPARSQFVPQLPFAPPGSVFGPVQLPKSPARGVAQQPFTPAPPSQTFTAPNTGSGFQPGAGNGNTFQAPSQPLNPPSQFGMPRPGTQPPSQPLPTQFSSLGWSPGTGNPNGFAPTSLSQTVSQNPPAGFQQANGFSSAPTSWEQPSYRSPDQSDDYEEDEGQSRPRVGLVIGLVALVLIILGGSLAGYFYVKPRLFATATPTPMPTPLPSPTGTPLFADQFTNNNSGWDLTSKPGAFSVKVGNGSMVLEDDNNRLLWELIPGGKNFSDFFLTVDASLSKGSPNNGYGIYIRGTSSQNLDIATYYRFELYGDGTFAVFKGTLDATGASNSQKLVDFTTTTAINPAGRVNHIAISAKGAVMTLYVNGQKLKVVTDNTYASGSIALFVSNLPQSTGGAAATFSNLIIYPPQSWA